MIDIAGEVAYTLRNETWNGFESLAGHDRNTQG